MTNKYILILMIDHMSVGEDIILKSLKYMNKSKKNYIIIGDINFYKKLKNKIFITDKVDKKILNKKIFFYHLFSHKLSNFKYINKITDMAISLLKHGTAKAVINMPINKKKYLNNKFLGYTEFFANKLMEQNKETMLLFNEKLSVVPVTTHCKVSQISKFLTKKKIYTAILNIISFYKKIIKKKVDIKILGLNPHAGIDIKKSSISEEKKIIIPIIKKIKRKIKYIEGPLSADTAFFNPKSKKKCIIGMFHDQVLPAFKALNKFNGANITLGLKYIRLSPDHGTGLNLLNKNKKKNINNKSFLYCIKFCEKYILS